MVPPGGCQPPGVVCFLEAAAEFFHAEVLTIVFRPSAEGPNLGLEGIARAISPEGPRLVVDAGPGVWERKPFAAPAPRGRPGARSAQDHPGRLGTW